jgi:hypothetical protein
VYSEESLSQIIIKSIFLHRWKATEPIVLLVSVPERTVRKRGSCRSISVADTWVWDLQEAEKDSKSCSFTLNLVRSRARFFFVHLRFLYLCDGGGTSGILRASPPRGSISYFRAYDNLFSDRTKKVSPTVKF